MPINPVSLIAGALSFSAALAWNKAISDYLLRVTGDNKLSSVYQAIVITLLIIVIVIIINIGVNLYIKKSGAVLKDSVIKAGGNKESKVSLWMS